MGRRIRVLVADDHPAIRDGLELLLEAEGFDVVGLAADGLEAVRLVRELRPDVAVMDRAMPRLNGVDAALEIRQASLDTRLVLLTGETGEERLIEALQAGFKGCVLKSHGARGLVQAIRAVARGRTYFGRGVSRVVVESYRAGSRPPPDRLSLSERQVLQLLAEGKKTRDVAELLSVSLKTVESRRARIMKKVGSHKTAGLVRYALREGLIQA